MRGGEGRRGEEEERWKGLKEERKRGGEQRRTEE